MLDPACGTGGFLVEALDHLMPRVETTQQLRALHRDLRGIEKKPLPYLLGMMNLLLHGVGQPNVARGNALTKPITQISKKERVDVILTNPPFGGEEEKSVQANFPADKRTSETAWLFLQLVIRQLKDGGRCGIVVPNGLLFGGGVGARIKQQLLTECNLHTVVRLPDGVFEPYTAIPSNLLFFEKTGRTKEVWFYEIPPPEGRKKYSKTKPMRFEEFADCQAWWNAREESERAWRVPIADLEATDFNLDLRNPHRPDDLAHRPPAELLEELVETEREILRVLEDLRAEVGEDGVTSFDTARVEDVLRLERRPVDPDPETEYVAVGVRSFGRGIFHYDAKPGDQLGSLRFFEMRPDRLVISNIKAWEGAVAVSAQQDGGCVASNRFLTYVPTDGRIETTWARWFFLSEVGLGLLQSASPGSADRNRTLSIKRFEALEIPLPPIAEQRRVAARLDAVASGVKRLRARGAQAGSLAENLPLALFNRLHDTLGA